MIENKPIALVTGLPGSGKTALLVQFIKDAAGHGRPIFQVGIPELKIPHIPPPSSMDDWTEMREDPDMPGKMLPYFTFPEKALIVLSEAQRLYRPRPSGAKVPDYVAAFETCRHTGVTFVLDTQHPDFIDSHVRKLVGQHIHLLDHGILGRKHYEWPYLGNPDLFKSAPIKKPYKLPKEIFGLYKSASLHVKRNYTFPPALKLALILIVLIAVGGYYIYGRIHEKVAPVTEVKAINDPTHPNIPQVGAPVFDRATMLAEFSPRVPGRPETASAFDELRKVKNMPQVVGCFQTRIHCACQNQQGLDAGLDELQCRTWLKSPTFDAYREIKPPVVAEKQRDDKSPQLQQTALIPAGVGDAANSLPGAGGSAETSQRPSIL